MTERTWQKGLKWLLGLWLAAVTAAALLWAPPAAGFQGHSFRIVFFHVPQAWVAVLAFCVNLVASLRYLRWRKPLDDDRATAAARLGLLFAVLATCLAVALGASACKSDVVQPLKRPEDVRKDKDKKTSKGRSKATQTTQTARSRRSTPIPVVTAITPTATAPARCSQME